MPAPKEIKILFSSNKPVRLLPFQKKCPLAPHINVTQFSFMQKTPAHHFWYTGVHYLSNYILFTSQCITY